MYWKKERGSEIEAIRDIIGRILDAQNPEMINSDTRDRLALKIAETVWMHQQHTKEDEKKGFLQDVHEDVEEILKRTEDRIQGIQRDAKGEIRSSKRQYSGPAIRKVMKILRDNLEKQFDPKNYPEDAKGFLQFNPLSHAWIDRENKLIFKIQDLLDKYNPGLFPNWKAVIISSIFMECNLWPNQNRDQAYERMRKRFPAAELKRREEADLQQKVAQDPLCELCGTFKSECKCDLLKI